MELPRKVNVVLAVGADVRGLIEAFAAECPGPDEIACTVELGEKDVRRRHAGKIPRLSAGIEIGHAVETAGGVDVARIVHGDGQGGVGVAAAESAGPKEFTVLVEFEEKDVGFAVRWRGPGRLGRC